LKHLYYIFITISLTFGTLPLKAELFTTANLSTESYNVDHSFRSTSSYNTSYQLPTGEFQSSIQFANGQIQTAAAQLNGNTTADQGGYIDTFDPTSPQRSIAPPQIAPLAFDWQVMLFILILCFIYVLWTMKHHKSQISEEKN
jgi:hypothetical protein